MGILPRDFYQRDAVTVARELIGKKLIRHVDGQELSGIIVEVEAYKYKDDPASHAYRGKTPRNEPMFGTVGCAYVYFIYGNHFCLNIVARAKGVEAGAVLIRGIEPVQNPENITAMKKNRNKDDIKILCNGPGKLTQAFCINKTHNFCDMTKAGELYVCDGVQVDDDYIMDTPRIGISLAQDKLWRFCLKNKKKY